MRDRTALILYIAAIITATLVHRIDVLAGALLVVFLLAGQVRWRLARRTGITILIFNSIVTAGYVLLAVLQGSFSLYFILLLNLRVFLLTYMTLLLNDRINLFKTLAFSRSLSFILTLAYSQMLTYRKVFEDFRLALRSRTPRRASLKDLYRHRAATGSFFLQKCYGDSKEITQAMTSRGFFDAER